MLNARIIKNVSVNIKMRSTDSHREVEKMPIISRILIQMKILKNKFTLSKDLKEWFKNVYNNLIGRLIGFIVIISIKIKEKIMTHKE